MTAFTWVDGERTIVYGEDAAAALQRLGWSRDADLLTTERADPGIGPALLVGDGQVPALVEALLPRIRHRRLVAWGGGRVIDVAKALASAGGGEVCAVPTTLSGAEMTSLHRKLPGREQGPSLRPVLVVADPALMCSMPEPALRASAMNALAHGAEALYGPRRNPVASLAGARGAQLVAAGDRALGSLLCAYAVDSAGYALHHVLCQTIVRIAATPHADTNAAMLPLTMAAMLPRAPQAMADLGAALGVGPEAIPTRIVELSGGASVDIDRDLHERIAEAALARAELRFTPAPEVTREELLGLLVAATSR
jgi:alcohol dehydrogenase class IV